MYVTKILDPLEIIRKMTPENSVLFYPYSGVPDTLISHYITLAKSTDIHVGMFDHDIIENHAKRIAVLVGMIISRQNVDDVIVYEEENGLWSIDDGLHRLRAHLYLSKNMKIKFYEYNNFDEYII